MPLLIINQTHDKTFKFTVRGKKYEVEPGSKNVLDVEACPLELTRPRSKGEVYVSTVSNADVEFFKELSQKAAASLSDVIEATEEVPLTTEALKTNKSAKAKTKVSEGESETSL